MKIKFMAFCMKKRNKNNQRFNSNFYTPLYPELNLYHLAMVSSLFKKRRVLFVYRVKKATFEN